MRTTSTGGGCALKERCSDNEWYYAGCVSGTGSSCSGCDGRAGVTVCGAGCQPTACRVGAEVCNNCDDNGDGFIDNQPSTTQHNSLTEPCNPNACSQAGTRTCSQGTWSACNGCAGTASCPGCAGRSGTRACASNCSVAQACITGAEECNGCDDDGDGAVDENLTRNPCTSQAGCTGLEVCVSGGYVCQFQAGSRRACSELGSTCPGATAECRADGTSGPCSPASPRSEDCNSCDDDHDGVVDNVPGQAMGSLRRECTGSAGACPGTSQACEVHYTNGGVWLDNRWSACVAPPEQCNGLDDDCDDSIDEADICSSASAPACPPTP